MLVCFKEDCFNCIEALMDCIVIKGEKSESILEKVLVLEKLGQSYEVTLLHYTPECDSAEVSKHLSEMGCDVKAMSRSGHTPLTTVVKHEGIRTVEVLLRNDGTICVGDPAKTSEYERVFYHMFLHNVPLQRDHRLVLQWFADKKSKDFATNERATMHLLRGYKDLVKLGLVAAGSVELAKFVLANGHDLEYRVPKKKWTALHLALILGKFDNAKMLIECGANVDAVDQYGKTPLSYYTAVEGVDDEKSELLLMMFERLKNSAVPDLEKILVEGRKETLKTVLQRIDVAQKSFSGGRDLLHLLIENKNEDALDVLEEVNVPFDVNSRVPTGETALMLAAHAGFVGKVEFLLRHGVDVNSSLDSGESALFYAVKSGMRGENYSNNSEDAEAVRMKILVLLLQNGADAQLVPENGKTLIDYLSRRRKVNKPMTKVFVAHLALLAATDESNLTDHTRDKIQSDETLKAHFDMYTRQLDEMKDTKLHGTVTLFKLLSERQGKIVGYARNPDLVSAFGGAMEGMSQLGYYYADVLHDRMASARIKAELMEKTALVVEELTGICTDAFHVVAYKIVGYLDSQDMKKLCEL